MYLFNLFCPPAYQRAKGTRERERATAKATEKEAKTARKTT